MLFHFLRCTGIDTWVGCWMYKHICHILHHEQSTGWLLHAELSVLDFLPRTLCKTLVLVKQVLLFLVRVVL